MKVPAGQIVKLPIDFTIVGGKIMYDRARDGEIKLPERERTSDGEGF